MAGSSPRYGTFVMTVFGRPSSARRSWFVDWLYSIRSHQWRGTYSGMTTNVIGASLSGVQAWSSTVSYTHLRAHETRHDLVCRLLLEKKKKPEGYARLNG